MNFAIQEMEKDFDEPRLSQLLSRRAMMKAKVILDDFSNAESVLEFSRGMEEDALRARVLAEKYHEPHLLVLSALAQTVIARKKEDFESAFKFIREAEKQYSELKRIPQYIETIIEYLKVIQLGLQRHVSDQEILLEIVSTIKNNVEIYLVDGVNVFEPEYCYLMGLILGQYMDAPREDVLALFADSICLAKQFHQLGNYEYFRKTCKQLGVLGEVEELITAAKIKTN